MVKKVKVTSNKSAFPFAHRQTGSPYLFTTKGCGLFVVDGTLKLKKKKKEVPGFLPLVGLVGTAVFVFTCFPIPVVGLNGMATAHPAGTGTFDQYGRQCTC